MREPLQMNRYYIFPENLVSRKKKILTVSSYSERFDGGGDDGEDDGREAIDGRVAIPSRIRRRRRRRRRKY